jgi:hypothetical protein
MVSRGNKLYSGGDKKVLVSDITTGHVLSVITRDSGDISSLAEKDNELFCSSTNGSTRTFRLTHTGKNIQMVIDNHVDCGCGCLIEK